MEEITNMVAILKVDEIPPLLLATLLGLHVMILFARRIVYEDQQADPNFNR